MSLARSRLSSHPQYRALSYCWGSLDELKPLTVVFEDDGDAPISSGAIGEPRDTRSRSVMFQVTANLHDALASFRRSEEHSYLWVDMLCINQGDVDERSEQVRSMRSIYESAESVVVWLGTDRELRDSVFAPENYEFALTNLAFEELGWTSGDLQFLPFVTGKVQQVMSTNPGLLSREDLDLEDAYWADTDSLVVGKTVNAYHHRSENRKLEGFEDSCFENEEAHAWNNPPCHSTFTGLLLEARPIFDKFPVDDRPRQTQEEEDVPPILFKRFFELVGLHGIGRYKKAPASFRHAFRDYRSRINSPGSEVWQWLASLLALWGLIKTPVPSLKGMQDRMSVIAKAPWFRRVWVIQEVASNKRVRIRVAEEEGSWEILRSLIKFTHELETAEILARGIGGSQVRDQAPLLWKDLAPWRDSVELEIPQLLDDLFSFSATDPRDKVISIYGIARGLQPGLFMPDYRWSVSETYAKFALAVIHSTGYLDILSDAQPGNVGWRRPDELPSWTSDFSQAEVSSVSPRFARGPLAVDKRISWSKQVRLKNSTNWRALHVEGLHETRVAEVVSVQVVEAFLSSRGRQGPGLQGLGSVLLPDLWACLNEVYSKTFPGDQDAFSRSHKPFKLTLSMFANALICGQPSKNLSRVIGLWHDQDPQFTSHETSQETRNELIQQMQEHFEQMKEHPPIHIKNLLGCSLLGMSFFFSTKGDLGVCTQGTRRGDLVVALFGLSHLVVLRALEGPSQNQAYNLIGNCTLDRPACDEAMSTSHDEYGASGEDSVRRDTVKSELFCLE